MYSRIKELADAKGITMVTLGRAVGASSGNMSDWKAGRSAPNVDKLIKIADYFGVTTDFLLGRDERYPAPSPDGCELMRIYDKLDREGRSIVLGEAYKQKQRLGIVLDEAEK